MPRGRKLTPLAVSDADRGQLQGVANSTTMLPAVVQRARMILASADGLTNSEVARRVGVSPQVVGKWRMRYLEGGIQGLHDEPRPGRPRTYDDEKVSRVINRALREKPPDATHWSTHSMGAAEGISASTVSRWFRQFGVRPHLAKTGNLSTDPFCIETVREIAGLYLNPPDHAIVLCVDGKSQIQASNRTQPKPPLDLGFAEGYTHDYLRHGTTTLGAALDIATGKVIAKRKARHRDQGFLSFLRLIDMEVPADLDIQLLLDNYPMHQYGRVKEWLDERPRYHLHITPTYSSWLDHVERWFGLLSEQALKPGGGGGGHQLVDRIKAFTEGHNDAAKPFVWAATAQSILGKVERLSTRSSDIDH